MGRYTTSDHYTLHTFNPKPQPISKKAWSKITKFIGKSGGFRMMVIVAMVWLQQWCVSAVMVNYGKMEAQSPLLISAWPARYHCCSLFCAVPLPPPRSLFQVLGSSQTNHHSHHSAPNATIPFQSS